MQFQGEVVLNGQQRQFRLVEAPDKEKAHHLLESYAKHEWGPNFNTGSIIIIHDTVSAKLLGKMITDAAPKEINGAGREETDERS